MNLKKSIYQTIVFYDLFDFPLTAEEILENLYGRTKPVHIKEVKGLLEKMPGVEEIREHFVLDGRGHLIDTRKSRKFISEKFWNRTSFYMQHMMRTPFVKMIAVCNNLSYDNASESSDIDLFIVIKEGRMWTARFILTVLLQFFGVRRYGDKVAGRFCLSFFVTEDATDIEHFKLKGEDPYLTYWAKHLAPVFGKDTYERIKKENKDFLKEKGLSFDEHPERHMVVSEKSATRSILEKILGGKLGDAFERLMQKTFKRRTLRRFKSLGPEANVIVTDRILKFHNNDRREEYREKWENGVKALMQLPEPEEDEK